MTDELDRLRKDRDALAIALYNVMFDLHVVYPTTSGPHATIGGQAMTPYCHVNHPYTEKHTELYEDAWQLLRAQLWRAEQEGYYLVER